jgi:hypothetical protein
MKNLFIVTLLLVFTACAPVNQTVSNVSNFVGGTQVVSYQTDAQTLATMIQTLTGELPIPRGYTPLRVTEQVADKVTVSAQALKGSLDTNADIEDFSLEFSLVASGDNTELTVRPSSASNDTARQLVTDFITLLDENFVRVE